MDAAGLQRHNRPSFERLQYWIWLENRAMFFLIGYIHAPRAPARARSGAYARDGRVTFVTRAGYRVRISTAPAKIPSTLAPRSKVTRSRRNSTEISSAVTIPVSRSAASGAVGPIASAWSARP